MYDTVHIRSLHHFDHKNLVTNRVNTGYPSILQISDNLSTPSASLIKAAGSHRLSMDTSTIQRRKFSLALSIITGKKDNQFKEQFDKISSAHVRK